MPYDQTICMFGKNHGLFLRIAGTLNSTEADELVALLLKREKLRFLFLGTRKMEFVEPETLFQFERDLADMTRQGKARQGIRVVVNDGRIRVL